MGESGGRTFRLHGASFWELGMHTSRRLFLSASTATLGTLALARSAHAGGDDVLKVGLIGCGGRGSGAASQALRADPNVKLVAMGDAFEDRLQNSLKSL